MDSSTQNIVLKKEKKDKTRVFDAEQILEKESALAVLCKGCEELADFPGVLYEFFEAYGKEGYLMKWAVEGEVKQAQNDPNSLCRGETLVTRMFLNEFFGDLGKRYLIHILVPLVEDVLEKEAETSLEIEAVKAANGVDVQANLSFFEAKIAQFMQRLIGSVVMCPIKIRELLMNLHQGIQAANFKESSVQIMSSIIFLRFFGPSLVDPIKYGLATEPSDTADDKSSASEDSTSISETHSEDKSLSTTHSSNSLSTGPSRGLVIVSKLLQKIANGHVTEAGTGEVERLVTQYHPKVVEFLNLLMDETSIKFTKRVIEASTMKKSTNKQRQEAKENLLKIIQSNQNINTVINEELQHRTEEQKLVELCQSTAEWKLVVSSKTKGVNVYNRKYENNPLLIFKAVGRMRCSLDTFYAFYTEYLSEYYKEDKRITSYEILEKHPDHTVACATSATFFPLAPREFLYAAYPVKTDHMALNCGFSVARESRPVAKGAVRGSLLTTGSMAVVDETDPNYLIVTSVNQVDMGGKFPAWLLNKQAPAVLATFLKVRAAMEQKHKERTGDVTSS